VLATPLEKSDIVLLNTTSGRTLRTLSGQRDLGVEACNALGDLLQPGFQSTPVRMGGF
jgi:hypothetical protein